MNITPVSQTDTEALRLILRLHDEMPNAWDPTHGSDSDRVEKMVSGISNSTDQHGFWILTDTPAGIEVTTSNIRGLIWAVIKPDYRQRSVCSINSLWIHPDHRQKNQVAGLADICSAWARAQGAVLLECSTHDQNQRMREILEKRGFRRGMIQYTLDLN